MSIVLVILALGALALGAGGCAAVVPRKGEDPPPDGGANGTGGASTYETCRTCHVAQIINGSSVVTGGLMSSLLSDAHAIHTTAPSGKITDPFACGRCHQRTPSDADVKREAAETGVHHPRTAGERASGIAGDGQKLELFGERRVSLKVGQRQALRWYDDAKQQCGPACHIGRPWEETDLDPANVPAKAWLLADPNAPYSIDCNSCHPDQHGDALDTNYLGLTSAQMCFKCHPGTVEPSGIISATGMQSTHLSGRLDRADDKKVCVACHDTHPNYYKVKPQSGKLPQRTHDVLNDADGCDRCHVPPKPEEKFSHSLVEPVAFNNNIPEVCDDCHGEGANADRQAVANTEGHLLPTHASRPCVDCHGKHAADPAMPSTILKPEHIETKLGADRLDFTTSDLATRALFNRLDYISDPNYKSAAWTVDPQNGGTQCVNACHGSLLPADVKRPERQPIWPVTLQFDPAKAIEHGCDNGQCHTLKPTPLPPQTGHTLVPEGLTSANADSKCQVCHPGHKHNLKYDFR